MMDQQLFEVANQLVGAGFQIAAIGARKAPAHAKGFADRPAAEVSQEAIQLVAAGKASGIRLELGERGALTQSDGSILVPVVYEWEGSAAADRDWQAAHAEAADRLGAQNLLDRISAGATQTTPSGGTHSHVLVRVEAPQQVDLIRSQAARIVTAAGKAETRAEILTSDAIVAPSGGPTHPSGKPYVADFGQLHIDQPVIDLADFELLRVLVQSIDQAPQPDALALDGLDSQVLDARDAYRKQASPAAT